MNLQRLGPLVLLLTLTVLAPGLSATLSVGDFGAVPDGETDCTAAFQQALQAAAGEGGLVEVPAGVWAIKGNLRIPAFVTLEGVARTAPTSPAKGSVLLAYAGKGSQEGPAFITLGGSAATLKGVIVKYPEAPYEAPPTPYPPCVEVRGGADNTAILDCLLLNPYEAIKLVYAGRHLVRNVTGYPAWRGLFIDHCYDVGRVENVHFWPFGVNYKPDNPYCAWINQNGVGFEFARTDWQNCSNCFCFGYGTGFKFSDAGAGGGNGTYVNIGADCSQTALKIEASSGTAITNGIFVGRWGSTDSIAVDIGPKVAGKVTLENCVMFGPISECVRFDSPNGQLSISGSNFANWDNGATDAPGVDLRQGIAQIQGNTFGEGRLAVRIGEGMTNAIVSGNLGTDSFLVDNKAGSLALVKDNLSPAPVVTEALLKGYSLAIGARGDTPYLTGWHGRGPAMAKEHARWSGKSPRLLLPVERGKAYELTLNLMLPEFAVSPEGGIFLAGKQVAALDKPYSGLVTFSIPPQEGDEVLLELRVKSGIPAVVTPANPDPRELGVMVFDVTMRQQGWEGQLLSLNTGKPLPEEPAQ